MDALTSITTHVPNWFLKLDALSSQIVQRQLELAALDETSHSRTKSIRNRGSTESLKAKDENEADPSPPPVKSEDDGQLQKQQSEAALLETLATTAALPPAHKDGDFKPKPDEQQSSSSPINQPAFSPTGSPAGGGGGIPLPKTMEELQARAVGMAEAKKVKSKSASIASINLDEKQPPTFRSRNIIIVYYDSFVQAFFEDLVKFVSASRNLMRKAKMAARVAHIKKMAEKEFSGEASQDGAGASPSVEMTLANIRMSRYGRMGSRFSSARDGAKGSSPEDPPDMYANLDESLEFVQTVCERAAHQFLRDGDCSDEVISIRKRLETTLETAKKELERLQKTNAAAGNDAQTVTKARTLRPASMRREFTPGKKSSEMLAASDENSTVSRRSGAVVDAPLEVDGSIQADWGSSRMMPAVQQQTAMP